MADQNSANDLWPSFEPVGPTRTPLTILKEVASALGPKTKNLVEAMVVRQYPGLEPGAGFTYALHLKAPALQGYSFGLLSINYGVELWPVRVSATVLNTILTADTEEAFRDVLKKILNHPQTIRVIEGMRAQSMAAADLTPGAA